MSSFPNPIFFESVRHLLGKDAQLPTENNVFISYEGAAAAKGNLDKVSLVPVVIRNTTSKSIVIRHNLGNKKDPTDTTTPQTVSDEPEEAQSSDKHTTLKNLNNAERAGGQLCGLESVPDAFSIKDSVINLMGVEKGSAPAQSHLNDQATMEEPPKRTYATVLCSKAPKGTSVAPVASVQAPAECCSSCPFGLLPLGHFEAVTDEGGQAKQNARPIDKRVVGGHLKHRRDETQPANGQPQRPNVPAKEPGKTGAPDRSKAADRR